MLVDELVAGGWSEAAARDEAEQRFGPVTPIRDACIAIDRRKQRRMTTMDTLEMLWLDFRVAFRALHRAPAFTAATVGTLTIGISAAATMFAVVNAVLLRRLPYHQPEQLVVLTHDMAPLSMRNAGITAGMFLTYRKLSHTLADIGAVQDTLAKAVNARHRGGCGPTPSGIRRRT